jgi:hypothetical protein
MNNSIHYPFGKNFLVQEKEGKSKLVPLTQDKWLEALEVSKKVLRKIGTLQGNGYIAVMLSKVHSGFGVSSKKGTCEFFWNAIERFAISIVNSEEEVVDDPKARVSKLFLVANENKFCYYRMVDKQVIIQPTAEELRYINQFEVDFGLLYDLRRHENAQ